MAYSLTESFTSKAKIMVLMGEAADGDQRMMKRAELL
jgi:hypothetical protein